MFGVVVVAGWDERGAGHAGWGRDGGLGGGVSGGKGGGGAAEAGAEGCGGENKGGSHWWVGLRRCELAVAWMVARLVREQEDRDSMLC